MVLRCRERGRGNKNQSLSSLSGKGWGGQEGISFFTEHTPNPPAKVNFDLGKKAKP
jgi:hypothetical protein